MGDYRGLLGIAVLFILLSVVSVSGEITEFSREGNDFSWTSGSYATSSHCVAGQTCTWISGNQVIVGVYYSNPNNWEGTVRWDFEIGVPVHTIEKVEVQVEWPHIYGKGLHSPDSSGWGSVSVKSLGNTIATLNTNVGTCSPTYDWYAHACGTWSLSYDVPLNLIEYPTTKVYIQTGSKTAWDVKRVKLFIYTGSGDVTIVDGKIHVKGKEFLVKSMDYAPWLQGEGPEPSHQPFPGEYDDVTDLVTSGGTTHVTDYSGDGRVQAWEVIQYDMESFKEVGANTVRTYASGEWHDKNLNGVIDRSPNPEQDEIVQGDMPNWMLDRVIDFCENNDMMVIIGYWVQEEDFKPGLDCNWDDLEVAKDTLRRVVERYGSSPAVLAWGIGNEVHGSWNHGWFTWTVDINEYLNALFSYVRSIDTNSKPIMYAKYIGENTDFNTLTAEIMAPNAYIFSAQELIDKGEFDLPAPEGKAYLLGEFGHMIEHAEGHWDLAKQYAGGCFLEYNDVWWKGSGYLFGIVDAYRKIKPERYNVMHLLYKGSLPSLPGDVNGDCKVNIFDLATVGLAYGSQPGDANWNPDADLNNDNTVNIFDLAMVGLNYGRGC